MEKYVLAIDQGTTSTRATIFNKNGELVCFSQKEIKNLFPDEGWVEADPLEIWLSVVDVVNDVCIRANVIADDFDSIGITNQRETTIVWDKATGKPIYNAIVWQSRQSQNICDKLARKKEFIHQRTGLLINPYFSASKIRFILDHVKGAQARAENGELLFGTIDTWLLYKMTMGKVHATDVTNASRTLLFNINTMSWDEDLLKLFKISSSMLPEVKDTSDDFGVAEFFTNKVHVYSMVGDQQASLFGHNCFEKGDLKNTYGTGCFMLMNIGEKPILSKAGLLTTVAWRINGKTCYAIEGSVFIGGAVITWIKDQLNLISSAKEAEPLAKKVKSSEGVYFVPAFVGLGTPYWDDNVRGTIFGLTRGTNKYHLIRATLESIAYQCKDVFDVIMSDANMQITSLEVDGGASANNVLMQFQSDILRVPVKKPKCIEVTALGAAYLAGLRSGFFKDLDDIKKCHTIATTYLPKMSTKIVQQRCQKWKQAIRATREFKIND